MQDSTKTRMSERMARISPKLEERYKEAAKSGKNTLKRVQIDAGFNKNKHSIAWTKMAVMLEQISGIQRIKKKTDIVEPETLPNTLQPCKEIDHQAQHSLQLKIQEKISSPTRPLD